MFRLADGSKYLSLVFEQRYPTAFWVLRPFKRLLSDKRELSLLADCCPLQHGQDQDIPRSGATRLAGESSQDFAVGR
jgi:hypothetical protein